MARQRQTRRRSLKRAGSEAAPVAGADQVVRCLALRMPDGPTGPDIRAGRSTVRTQVTRTEPPLAVGVFEVAPPGFPNPDSVDGVWRLDTGIRHRRWTIDGGVPVPPKALVLWSGTMWMA